MSDITRRTFGKLAGGGLAIVAVGGESFLTGCSASEVEADIATVLQDLPTAISIIQEIITIVSLAKGGQPNASIEGDVTNWSGQVAADLKLADILITTYKTDLMGAPASVITELDDAVADANANLQSILDGIHVYDSATQAAIGVAVSAADAVLLGLESILPKQSVSKFPRTAAVILKRPGAHVLGSLQVGMPKAHDLAVNYNAGIRPNFPSAVVKVPRAHWYSL